MVNELILSNDDNLKTMKHILTVWENLSRKNRLELYSGLKYYGKVNFNRELSLFLVKNRVNFELDMKKRFKSLVLLDDEDIRILNELMDEMKIEEGSGQRTTFFFFLNKYLYKKYVEDKNEGK